MRYRKWTKLRSSTGSRNARFRARSWKDCKETPPSSPKTFRSPRKMPQLRSKKIRKITKSIRDELLLHGSVFARLRGRFHALAGARGDRLEFLRYGRELDLGFLIPALGMLKAVRAFAGRIINDVVVADRTHAAWNHIERKVLARAPGDIVVGARSVAAHADRAEQLALR